ncbi:MAG: hypothetical protein A2W17_04275 [Planctomycetes bacterium RBG_16_41_13]|nr:MAG: hypothetical protein A2W17_04275 [Planctomycetes bacterium RBG_16_41_13]
MEYAVRKKEPSRRFIVDSGVVEYTDQDLENMRKGTDEKEFDDKRYGGPVCVGCAGCGYGACRQI